MKTRAASVVLLLLLPLASARAAVNNIDVALTDPGSVLPNFTTNDLRIDFTGGLRGQLLVVNLTAGSIFNEKTLGSDLPPPLPLLSTSPTLQYDSFLALGGLTQQTSFPIVTALGTIVPSCDPLAGCRFIIAWAPETGVEIPAGDNFVVARLTLSGDFQGTVHYFGSTVADTGEPFFTTGTIQNGVITFVPEPTTLGLLAFSFLLLTANARRLRCFRNLPG